MKKLLLLLVLIVSMSLTSVYAQREPYAVLSNGTLTFYYNSDKPYGAYSLIYKDQPEWKNVSKDIRKVVIDDSLIPSQPAGSLIASACSMRCLI